MYFPRIYQHNNCYVLRDQVLVKCPFGTIIFFVAFDRAYKDVSAQILFSVSVFFCYMTTLKKQCTVPVTLTFEG